MMLTMKREIVKEYLEMIKEFHMLVEAAVGGCGNPVPLPELETGVICEFKAYTIEVTEADLVFTVKDEFVLDVLKLYRRAFPLFAPVIGSAVGAFKVMGTYVKDFAEKWSEQNGQGSPFAPNQTASPKLSKFDTHNVCVNDEYGESKVIQVLCPKEIQEDSMFTLRQMKSYGADNIELSISDFAAFALGDDPIASDHNDNVLARDKRKSYIIRKMDPDRGSNGVTEVMLKPQDVARILGILGSLDESELEKFSVEQREYDEARS